MATFAEIGERLEQLVGPCQATQTLLEVEYGDTDTAEFTRDELDELTENISTMKVEFTTLLNELNHTVARPDREL